MYLFEIWYIQAAGFNQPGCIYSDDFVGMNRLAADL